MHYMMRFLVGTFSDLKFVPDEAPLHPVNKTDVTSILFRDEKYISETIENLTKLFEDAN